MEKPWEEAAGTAAVLDKYGVDVILDYGVEGKAEEAEYDKAVPEFIKAIIYAASQKNIPFISIKVTGFGRFGLLEKVHAGADPYWSRKRMNGTGYGTG